MKTKQEQKNEAWEAYYAIVTPVEEAFNAIEVSARKARNVIVKLAWVTLRARIKEIDEQDEPLEVEKEI